MFATLLLANALAAHPDLPTDEPGYSRLATDAKHVQIAASSSRAR